MSTDLANSTDPSAAVPAPSESWWARLRRALGPTLPGLVLDLADLGSLTTHVGPWASFSTGLVIGVWLSLYYQLGVGWRCVIAIASGLYTLAPGTEYIPLATILTCLGRFLDSAPSNRAAAFPVTDTSGPVDVQDDQEAGFRTRTTGSRAACPECGSNSLRYGQVAQRFWPTGSSLWAKGHEINAFVCLECGFVGHFLASADVEQMRDSPC